MSETDNVGPVTTEQWYTQGQLLKAAEQHGLPLSQGLLEKWVVYGLVDRGRQHGRGRGQGATFLWPHSQLELVLLLLEKRRTVSRVRTLLNVPIGIWTYWGEDYVPMRQVRRAMESWSDVGKRAARHNWNAMAKRVVDEVAHPGSGRREREVAADLIAELARKRQTSLDDLIEALEPVVGREDPRAFTDAPRAAHLLVAQVTALDQIQELPDELFRWARAMILVTQANYIREQPELARDPRFSAMHPSPTFEAFVQSACSNLITTLGLYLVQPVSPNTPRALNAELWKEGKARMSAHAAYRPSRDSLPPWAEGGRIQVDVRIEVDPEG